MATTIESLELEIQQNSTSAVNGINALSQTLQNLKNATKGITGLQRVANGISAIRDAANGVSAESANRVNALADALRNISQAGRIPASIANQLANIGNVAQSLNGVSFAPIESLATSLGALSGLGQFTISSSIANQLVNIGVAAETLQGVQFDAFQRLAEALQPLMNLGNFDLRGLVNSLNRIPRLANVFNGVDWGTFTGQIQQMTTALAPLTTQLNTLSEAFNRLPANLRNAVNATNRLSTANRTATTSYVNLWARARIAYNAIRTGARLIGQWINKSNEYIENVNLFTASLGKYADEAKAYADQVSELMGIDPAVWMRQQGVFNTITKGFGVATDKAFLMSQQLTQLGYDISSFYNISVEDAMTKLQSGISGELEPLRRLGYDLSVARLQEEALALGITKKVSKMTQAEKSQLRYVAIMKQVNTSHGDMARTLQTPANMLRILKAQFEQLGRAMGNLFLPTLQAVLPWLIAIVKVLREIIEGMASLVGFEMPKIDYTGISDVSDEAEKATKDVKELKRTLMGFDEINKLNDNKDKSKNGSSGSRGSFDLDLTPYSYDFLGGLNSQIDDIVAKIKGALQEIQTVASGFALALGVLLVASGVSIPLGLGLIAIGAVGIGKTITENWNTMSDRLAGVLSQVTAMLSGFMLAIGILLAVTGHPALGVALIIAGAASLVTSTVIDWNFLSGKIESVLAMITGIVGGAMLGLGAILALTGHPAVGVALLAAGALGLAASVSISWNEMPNRIRELLSAIGAIAGGFMLALGLLLLSTPTALPIAIGVIAAGAVSLASAAVINWGYIATTVSKFLSSIAGLITGSALLAIGIILTMTGVATPLGIGLLAVGATSLATSVALNWSNIQSYVLSFLKELGGAIGLATLVLGVILVMTGVFTPLGIGLIAVGAAGLASNVALNWSNIVSRVTGFFNSIKSLFVGPALIALGLLMVMTGAFAPLGIGLIALGGVSLATSLAFNWSTVVNKVKGFLKEVGDNFSKTWNNIKTWTTETWDKVKTKVSTVTSNVRNWVTTRFNTAKNAVKTAWENASTWTKNKWVDISNAVSTKTSNIKTWASERITSAGDAIHTTWNNVSDWTETNWDTISSTVERIWSSLSENAQTVFSGIGGFVSDAWGDVQTGLSNFTKWLNNTFGDSWEDAWKGIVNGFGTVFNNIKTKAKEPINSVIGFINSMISKVETAVNRIRKGISNAVKIDIPEKTLFEVFGQKVTVPRIYWKPLNLEDIKLTRVNKLASGAIVDIPTMLTPNIMAGEAGREAVLPLDRNTEWMDALAARVNETVYQNTGDVDEMSSDDMSAVLRYLSGIANSLREIERKDTNLEISTSQIIKAQSRTNRRAGVTVVAVGT